jgi:hypothetical protein
MVMAALFCSTAFAGEIELGASTSGVKIIADKMQGQDKMSLKMTCSIDKLNFYDAETPAGNFTVLYSPQFYFGGEYGAPQLPVYTKLVQIPFGADFKVEIKGYDTEVYNLADFGISDPVFPRQPSAPKDGTEVPFVYEKAAYVFKGFPGYEIVSLEEKGTLRHMRLAHLNVSPVRYNPVDNKIKVFNNIEFEITFSNADMAKTRAAHKKLWSPAFATFEKMVEVPQALRFGERNTKQSYVIVSDPAFKKDIAPFAAWKTQKGFIVNTVYTDEFGTTSDEIRNGVKKYIHDLYNNPTSDMPAPSFVLFVGDNEQIPAFKGQTGSHITDLYYVAVTPGDFLPDILTGRFSAQTSEELIPQIEKTLEYEKFQFPDPSFLDDIVLTAGWDYSWARSHGWSHINYARENYINTDNGFNKISTYLSAGSQQNVSEIVANVGKGVAYYNYTAHGSTYSFADPRFTISDIQNLGNKSKYPLIIGNCCITNRFEYAQCFGEAWLRTKDAGAIGYVGGSNSTYWDEDLWWGVGLHSIVKPNNDGVPPLKSATGPGAFDTMFDVGTTNAGFMVAGNLAVEESTSTRKHYYWEVYHLMGDPALITFMGQPKKMRVSFSSSIDSRQSSVMVLAPAGSYVGISHDNNLLGAGYVSADGYAKIELTSVPESGNADIVVTAANSVPFMGQISIK